MKKIFLLLAVIFSLNIIAQPSCILAGFNYSPMMTTVKNYSFTRNLTTDSEGNPITEFSNTKDAVMGGGSAGFSMDIYTKHWRIASDINFPFKGGYSSFFNFNLAYGGYIKEKFGILGGILYYRNIRMNGANYTGDTGNNFKEHTFSTDLKENGNYYFNGVPVHSAGLNGILTFAPAEKFVIRADYAFMLTNILHKKDAELEGYDWKQDKSRKLELGMVWQISDYFGLGVKYFNWNVSGTYKTDYNYQFPGVNNNVLIDIVPQREYNMRGFAITLMIPTGMATSTKYTTTSKTQ